MASTMSPDRHPPTPRWSFDSPANPSSSPPPSQPFTSSPAPPTPPQHHYTCATSSPQISPYRPGKSPLHEHAAAAARGGGSPTSRASFVPPDMPRRRPLNTSSGNAMSPSPKPLQAGNDASPEAVSRKASYEIGDDAMLARAQETLEDTPPPTTYSAPFDFKQTSSPEYVQSSPPPVAEYVLQTTAPPVAQFLQTSPRRKSVPMAPPLAVPSHVLAQHMLPMRPHIPPDSNALTHPPLQVEQGTQPLVEGFDRIERPHSAQTAPVPASRNVSGGSIGYSPISERELHDFQAVQPLQYFHQPFDTHAEERERERKSSGGSNKFPVHTQQQHLQQQQLQQLPPLPASPPVPLHGGRLTPVSPARLGVTLPRPESAYSLVGSDMGGAGGPIRTLSPGTAHLRTPSPSRQSPDPRPMSFVDLLNVPYPQPPPAPTSLDNANLRSAVGVNATLLNTKQTLEMYRANAKKTNDATLQYEFAVFMVNAAAELAAKEEAEKSENRQAEIPWSSTSPAAAAAVAATSITDESSRADLLREARSTLQRLSDRSYPFAQYYLADGYASGLFNKGTPDDDRAFPLFVSASKHGHAEAGYRAALCYEYGWGCRKDPTKAVQFYRHSASKNHPGAMARLGRACLTGDMGLGNKYREGLKWLKRAAESADTQYNSAPYELGLLHEKGYGDDIFIDEAYAAQLFTQSADLGHPEANFRLGDAYEHGTLACPQDAALSVHFYNGAAERGHARAMMALCAWYMVGAGGVLEKDEAEAYEWARRAAETGLTKAQYALGFFTETGIGCRRDPLEANVWYVRAAESGDERASQRIAAIRLAAEGGLAGDVAGIEGGRGSAGRGGRDHTGSPSRDYGVRGSVGAVTAGRNGKRNTSGGSGGSVASGAGAGAGAGMIGYGLDGIGSPAPAAAANGNGRNKLQKKKWGIF